MRVLLLSGILLLGALVAGCVDDPVAPAPDDPGAATDAERTDDTPRRGASADAPLEVLAPTWSVGDWWSWRVTPRDAPEYEAKTIVAEVTGQGYKIGWETPDQGLRSQFFHFIPSGDVSMDLVWEAHHEPVTWFDFPLTDNKTWTGGIWMGPQHFQTTATDIVLPDGTLAPGFRIEGSDEGGGVRTVIDWAPALDVFTRLEFYLHDEVPWLALDLLAHGSAHTGEVHLLHSEMVLARFTGLEHVPHGADPPVPETIEVPAEATHVSMGCYMGGGAGYYTFRFTDAAQTAHGCEVHTTDDWFGLQIAYGPIAPGTAVTTIGTAGRGTVFTELYLATDDVRTL